jgi:hypothetical protein
MVIKALMGLVDTYLANKTPDQKPPPQRVVLSLILIALLALLHISFWITRLNGALKRYIILPPRAFSHALRMHVQMNRHMNDANILFTCILTSDSVPGKDIQRSTSCPYYRHLGYPSRSSAEEYSSRNFHRYPQPR